MKDMEMRIYLEQNYYNADEMIEDYLPRIKKHIGFVDDRRDKRFIVKFHDIMPKENMDEKEFNRVFEWFCNDMHEMVIEQMRELYDTDEDEVTGSYSVGHYYPMRIDIEEITEDNLMDVLIKIYEEGVYPDYIDKHVGTVKLLKELEDNYVEWWEEYVNDWMTQK